jgi:hypothetical protein
MSRLLLLRHAERNLGICRRLADAMPDRRDANRIRHEMFEMVMARVCAIACGHEDAIDLDRSVMKWRCGVLASTPGMRSGSMPRSDGWRSEGFCGVIVGAPPAPLAPGAVGSHGT